VACRLKSGPDLTEVATDQRFAVLTVDLRVVGLSNQQ